MSSPRTWSWTRATMARAIELPGMDLSGEELTMVVIAKHADEFAPVRHLRAPLRLTDTRPLAMMPVPRAAESGSRPWRLTRADGTAHFGIPLQVVDFATRVGEPDSGHNMNVQQGTRAAEPPIAIAGQSEVVAWREPLEDNDSCVVPGLTPRRFRAYREHRGDRCVLEGNSEQVRPDRSARRANGRGQEVGADRGREQHRCHPTRCRRIRM